MTQTHEEWQESERVGVIAHLREIADWLEAHPQHRGVADSVQVSCQSAAEFVAIARSFGTLQKVPIGSSLHIRHTLPGGARLFAGWSRAAVCRRIKTGTRTVTVPAREAQPASEVVEDVYEWDCSEGSILALGR